MKVQIKLLLLGVITVLAIIAVVMQDPIPQDQLYHVFADRTTWLGVPNFANVISNVPFLFVGVFGLCMLRRSNAVRPVKVMYAVVFVGIVLTGLGSAYYHYAPGNYSLVYDRIPMTIVFMAFLAVAISEWISLEVGILLLLPLLLLGISSVVWWYYTELNGVGDLRFYGFVQFYPTIVIPVIFLLFRSGENNRGLRLLIGVIVWYVVAKLCERFDGGIYDVTGFVSGHSIKHVAAAVATWYIVKFFRRKYVLE